MPVLIILLFYVNDLIKIHRYYSLSEFAGQITANILQNISQKRTDKKITLLDMKYALACAWQSVYTGTSLYYNGKGHETIHFPYVNIFFVKGLSGGKASCYWAYNIYSYTGTTAVWSNNTAKTSDFGFTTVRYKTDANPSDIHPKLTIKEGEVKIIIESNFWWRTGDTDANGKTVSTSREAFKLYLVTPLSSFYPQRREGYFSSITIFTPKPGLFSETAPS